MNIAWAAEILIGFKHVCFTSFSLLDLFSQEDLLGFYSYWLPLGILYESRVRQRFVLF